MEQTNSTSSGRTIALFGASGRMGLVFLEQAIAAGHKVRAIVRTPAKLGPLAEAAGVEVIRAGLGDADALRKAVVGVDAVVSCLGSSGLNPRGFYTMAFKAIVEAMQANPRARLLAVTSSGHEEDPEFPLFFKYFLRPIVLRKIYANMAEAEKIIEGSNLSWTIVRPSMLVKHDPAKAYRVRDRLNPSGGWKISREHSAQFMLDEINKAEWVGRHPALAY